ncbi:MAG: condensation domain-containing protein [Acidimicrobiales bacterium]
MSPTLGSVRLGFRGPRTDHGRLSAALVSVLKFHPALRSIFRRDWQGGWECLIRPECDYELLKDESRDFSVSARGPEYSLFSAHHVDTDDHSELLIEMNHLIVDAISLHIFIKTLNERLESLDCGSTDDGYVNWLFEQDDLIGSARHFQLAEFWHRKFEACGMFPELPFRGCIDGDRVVSSWTTLVRTRVLPKFVDYVARSRLTIPAICLALLANSFRDLYGSEVLVFHLAAANRKVRTKSTVGWLANTVAVRVEPSWGCSLEELARKILMELLTASDHAELPLNLVVPDLYPNTGVRAPRIFVNFEDRRVLSGASPTKFHRIEPPRDFVAGPSNVIAEFALCDEGLEIYLLGDAAVASNDDFVNVRSRLIEYVSVLESGNHLQE